MVDLPSQPLGDIDPEFQKIALETGELTYGLSGTSTREKLLLNLANDVCREHFGLAFRLHVQEIEMDRELDAASKMDRHPSFVREMFTYGEEQTEEFLTRVS